MLSELFIDHVATFEHFENDWIFRSIEVDYTKPLAVPLVAWWVDYAVDIASEYTLLDSISYCTLRYGFR